MRVNEFIKKFGWSSAFDLWQGSFDLFDNGVCILNGVLCSLNSEPYFSLSDLKLYIDAYELVQPYGGINAARKEAHKNCFEYDAELLRAITLVEECQ